MIIDGQKIKVLIKSASFNTISCLFNNLIYLVIIHYLSLNSKNASLQQNGISLAQTVLTITFDPVIGAFANGLKILYSQYFATIDLSNNRNINLLLYQSIAVVGAVGLTILFLALIFMESFFAFLNYQQVTIDLSMICLVYIFISKLIFIVYEFQRAQLLGMKVFGPFAYFQTASFVLTAILCEIFHNTTEVGIHQAGILFILHDTIKVGILMVYNARNKKIKEQPLLQEQNSKIIKESMKEIIYRMIKEKHHVVELITYVKPLVFIIFLECLFFNVSIILSGKFSSEYVVAAVCFSMTNTLIFKGIQGLYESLVSFAGTAFAAKDFKGAKEYLIYTITILLCYEGLFILLLTIFQNFWASSFSQEPIVIELIHTYKYIYLLTIPFDGTQVLLSAYLQTVEKKTIVQKTELVNFILIGIPAIYIMGDVLDLKLGGIWTAIGICNILNVIVYAKAIRSIDYDVQYKIVCANQEMVESKSNEDDDENIPTQELLPMTLKD